MNIREIRGNEIASLYEFIAELSAYHNEVSANFKGVYPTHDYNDTLEKFKMQVASGRSHITVIGDESICGFCKVYIDGTKGKLDYLMVTREQRGKGYGKVLMDWAMKCFVENGVSAIEVKVIDGNPTIHLYEKYGFKTEALMMRCDL